MIEFFVRVQIVCLGLAVVGFVGHRVAGRYDHLWLYLMVIGLGGIVGFGALAFVAPLFGVDYPDR
jgi:hypothetical protein